MNAIRVRNSKGREIDVAPKWVEANSRLFGPKGKWKVVDLRGNPNPLKEIELPEKPGGDPPKTAQSLVSLTIDRRPVLIHVIAEPIRATGLVYNVAECAEWAAESYEVHVIAPAKGSVDVPVFSRAKLHLVKSDDEGIVLIRSLKPALIRHHSPASRWLLDGYDGPLIGTCHNWQGNVDPAFPWVVPVCGPKAQARHGVDLKKFKPRPFQVGIVGRIDPMKIPLGFLKALASFDSSEIEFHIYGPTLGIASGETIKRKLAAISHVTVHGELPRAGMVDVYQGLDILLAPSSQEAAPLVVMEALACGLPVIARNIPGMEDMIGEGGRLCDDDARIFAAIQRLNANRSYLHTLGQKARAQAEKQFDAKRMFADYHALYKEKIKAASAPVPVLVPPNSVIEIKGRPRIMLAVDQLGRPFGNIARQLKKHLSDEFQFIIKPYTELKKEKASTDLCVYFWWHTSSSWHYKKEARHTVLCLYDTFKSSEYMSWQESPDFPTMAESASVIIAGNDRIARLARKRTHTPVYICEDGVDLEMFPALPLPPEFCIGWTGSNSTVPGNKGVEMIVEAGRALGVPVLIHDWNNNKTLHEKMSAEFYQKISCYVCASKEEGTPNPVLEALASGRPVVSTNVGIIPKVISENTGVIVHRSAGEIGRGILKIMCAGPENFQASARQAAEAFSWKLKAEDWRKAFRFVFGERR